MSAAQHLLSAAAAACSGVRLIRRCFINQAQRLAQSLSTYSAVARLIDNGGCRIPPDNAFVFYLRQSGQFSERRWRLLTPSCWSEHTNFGLAYFYVIPSVSGQKKVLGVVLDLRLTFEKHATALARSYNYHAQATWYRVWLVTRSWHASQTIHVDTEHFRPLRHRQVDTIDGHMSIFTYLVTSFQQPDTRFHRANKSSLVCGVWTIQEHYVAGHSKR